MSRGQVVILIYDPAFRGLWLADYFPGLVALDESQMPPLSLYGEALGSVEVLPDPIPHDCIDGFLCAYWRRPAAYFDPGIRAAMSSFHALGDVSHGLARLEADLVSGEWQRRFGNLLDEAKHDCGYRLVITR